MPHQKNIFCMTLKIKSKALKHVIVPWHVSSTWPIYDLNVDFKYSYWAFLFMFVFIYYVCFFSFAYGKKRKKKERVAHVSVFTDMSFP